MKNKTIILFIATILINATAFAAPQDDILKQYHSLKKAELTQCLKEAREASRDLMISVSVPVVKPGQTPRCFAVYNSCMGGKTNSAVIFWMDGKQAPKNLGELAFNGRVALSQVDNSCIALNEGPTLIEGKIRSIVFTETKITSKDFSFEDIVTDENKESDRVKIKNLRARQASMNTKTSECVVKNVEQPCLLLFK